MKPLLMLFCACLLAGCATREVERDLPYVADGSAAHLGDLYLPQGAGPFPAVLVIHGGGWIHGDRSDGEGYARRLADAGFAAYNIEYRLAPADRFPAQLDDVKNALRWLSANATRLRIDPERLGLMGYSAGAHLALLAGLAGEPDVPRVRAIVAGAGPADLSVYPASPYIFQFIGGPPTEFPAEYAAASPIHLASADDPPVLLYHGRMDRLVEIEQSRNMLAALQQAGVPARLIEVPLSGHVTTFLFDGLLFGQVTEFLGANLAQK
jgi:acetyl esterase/lipase